MGGRGVSTGSRQRAGLSTSPCHFCVQVFSFVKKPYICIDLHETYWYLSSGICGSCLHLNIERIELLVVITAGFRKVQRLCPFVGSVGSSFFIWTIVMLFTQPNIKVLLLKQNSNSKITTAPSYATHTMHPTRAIYIEQLTIATTQANNYQLTKHNHVTRCPNWG